MKMSIRGVLIGAALLAGCNGTIGGQGGTGSPTGTNPTGTNPTGTPTGTPTGVSTGTAGSGINPTGAGGSGVVTPPTACTPGVPATSQLPRLSRVEYDNTTKDLLGLDVQPSSMLAPDTTGAVDQRAWDGFQAAADSLAAQVMANPTAKAKVIPCTADTAACAQQFVTSFGQKAFRRPLTTAEVTRFTNFYTNRATLTQNGTLDQAFQLIIKAFLLSPSFLTKAEISETASGANYALSGYEMASRLSYMLWGTMPDDVLFAEAAANRLTTPAQILTQAQRMIADPRARTRIGEFHAQYMMMGEATRWTEAAHDATKFPAFKASMVPMLAESTKRFLDYVTFDPAGGGKFQDLILKPVAFVNRDLAPIYGLTSTATDYTLANLDQAQRAGVLTQAGFLASFSSFDRTSPILRGAFIEKNVLCRTIGSPPPDAAATPLPNTGNTNRERVTAQTSAGACAGCHATVVNPPGFALEAYDSVGMWQTTEKGTSFAIDTAADVAIGANVVKVTGPVDLMQKIAASPEGQSCYAQRWVQFAYERDLTSQDVCTVQSIQTKMAGNGYTILSLVTDLTQSESFRYRAKELP
jgi:hypothetical protein